jgi:hypothetical protein
MKKKHLKMAKILIQIWILAQNIRSNRLVVKEYK